MGVSTRNEPAAQLEAAAPVSVRPRGLALRESQHAYIRRKVGRRLGRFAPNIERVSVRVTDVNGPRGGVDKLCRLRVVLRHMESVVVERQHHDPRAAFDLALDAARQSVRERVRREFLERRRPARVGRRPPHELRVRHERLPEEAGEPTLRSGASLVDERVDEVLAETFPASDSPPWTLGPPSWAEGG